MTIKTKDVILTGQMICVTKQLAYKLSEVTADGELPIYFDWRVTLEAGNEKLEFEGMRSLTQEEMA